MSTPFAMPKIDNKQLRYVFGQFATGVTIVTTKTYEGKLIGVTVNSFSSVSLEPPLILFSLAKSSYSFPVFFSRKRFAVNVLSEDQYQLSVQFSTRCDDKWDGVKYRFGSFGDCPVLTDALAIIECKTKSIIEVGDHSVFIGAVLNCKIDIEGRPLLFYKGKYRTVAQ